MELEIFGGIAVRQELLSNLVYDGLFMRRLCCP